MKQIFIGGYATSGSRVPTMLLERAGYYAGIHNDKHDFGGMDFVDVFSRWYIDRSKANENKFRTFIDHQINGRNSFVLKAGHLMLIIPQLKQWYPNSKFILTVRHPIDQLCRWKGFYFHHKILLHDAPTELRDNPNPLDEYVFLHNKAIINTDLVWKLEDVCFDTVTAISKLFKFADIEDDPQKYVNLITVSPTIGIYKKIFTIPIIQKLGYT